MRRIAKEEWIEAAVLHLAKPSVNPALQGKQGEYIQQKKNANKGFAPIQIGHEPIMLLLHQFAYKNIINIFI